MTQDIVIQDKATIFTVQDSLAYAGYANKLIPFKKGSELCQLMIGPGAYMAAPGLYDYEKPYYLTMFFFNDMLESIEQETDELMDSLQLTATLPIVIPEEKRQEAMLMMNEFNLILPIGTFVLTDQGLPHFRYSWQVFERNVEGILLGNMVGTALFFIERLGYKFEELAVGEKTLEQILKEEIDFRS